jgi:HAMP domain-containing protein
VCDEAADEIERLRAALEVSQAATNAAVNKAQWQARTNAELNALQDEVRRFRAEAIRRLNDEFGA